MVSGERGWEAGSYCPKPARCGHSNKCQSSFQRSVFEESNESRRDMKQNQGGEREIYF